MRSVPLRALQANQSKAKWTSIIIKETMKMIEMKINKVAFVIKLFNEQRCCVFKLPQKNDQLQTAPQH